MHNSFILQQYVCYTTILNMFRAERCSSSGGQIVSPQPLVSSPSANSRTVCRWRAAYVCYTTNRTEQILTRAGGRVEVVASLSQGRTAAAQCGSFTYKSVPVIFEPPCKIDLENRVCGLESCGSEKRIVVGSCEQGVNLRVQ